VVKPPGVSYNLEVPVSDVTTPCFSRPTAPHGWLLLTGLTLDARFGHNKPPVSNASTGQPTLLLPPVRRTAGFYSPTSPSTHFDHNNPSVSNLVVPVSYVYRPTYPTPASGAPHGWLLLTGLTLDARFGQPPSRF